MRVQGRVLLLLFELLEFYPEAVIGGGCPRQFKGGAGGPVLPDEFALLAAGVVFDALRANDPPLLLLVVLRPCFNFEFDNVAAIPVSG
jgi:hypothetical protein